MLSRIIWTLVLSGLATAMAGWWFDWNLTKDFSIDKVSDTISNWTKSLSDESIKNIPEKISGTINGGTGTVSQVFNKAFSGQKDAALDTYDEVKGSIIEETKEKIEDALNAIESGLGLEKNTELEIGVDNSQLKTSFSVAITAQARKPVSFLIKNKNYSSSEYTIKWGDGEENSGEIKGNSEKLISHIWSHAGEYTIILSDQKFLIKIVE